MPEPGGSAVHPIEQFLLRLPYAVVGLSPDLHVAFANDRAVHLLGESALLGGEPMDEATVGPELRAIAERLVAVSAPLAPIPVELPDGRTLRIGGVGRRDGEPAVLLIEDVTEQVRHDRIMREFVRNAAHQLRTPLTGIVTAVEVLQAGAKDVPGDRDRFLDHVERHTGRLTRMAHGLLVLARAQSGQQVMRLEFVEVRPLLEALAREAEPAAGIEIEVDCPEDVAALAEPDLVHEALAALVDNAVAHTADGTVRLHAREAGGRVSIEVSDTGSGIATEHRDRIFEPFYRVGDAGDGFGLGLAIASQAVEAMAGELRTTEREGGTTFTLRLPSAQVVR